MRHYGVGHRHGANVTSVSGSLAFPDSYYAYVVCFMSWTSQRMWVKFETITHCTCNIISIAINLALEWAITYLGGRVQFGKIRGFLLLLESVSDTTDRKPNLCVGRLSWRSSFYRVKRKEPDCLTSVNTSHGHFLRPSLTAIESSLLKSCVDVVIPLHCVQSRFQFGVPKVPKGTEEGGLVWLCLRRFVIC